MRKKRISHVEDFEVLACAISKYSMSEILADLTKAAFKFDLY